MKGDLLDAFFTWVLDGAIEWYANGLVDIQENDEIGEFLADSTEQDPAGFILSSELFRMYTNWCRDRRTEAKGLKAFSQDMSKKYKKERKKSGQAFIGLKIPVIEALNI
eukprot:TRINITY_DN1885_c0_g2_i15.p2 TRINITY_DN1885_c0_g2~~TRINITY_DN1885_c0_g2_i15.p2  ORF type:complete len:109 (+),score=19.93 TRINITY_DN1885_c0_g2_i15:389-715(+)